MKITFLLPHLKLSGGAFAPIVFAHRLSLRGHQVTVAVESKSWTRYVHNLFSYHALLPLFSRVRIVRVNDFSELTDGDAFIAVAWQTAKKLHFLNIHARKFYYIQHDERLYHGDPASVEETLRYPLVHIANASWLQSMLKQEFNEEVPLLINAVDCSQFHPSNRTRNTDDDVIKILVLHHDYVWKGTREGVQAVKTLQIKYPKVKLVLFGTREKKIEYTCDEYYFKLHGDSLARLFANTDIFVGSSWDEGLNFPPRWAMASGCAVVTYSNGSSDDYAFDGQTALVAERKNTEDLVRKLELLVVDVALRKQLAKQGMEYVRNMPTWEALTDILEDIVTENGR
jgi:glycosyltransferase involved in cell wall biosynthesis